MMQRAYRSLSRTRFLPIVLLSIVAACLFYFFSRNAQIQKYQQPPEVHHVPAVLHPVIPSLPYISPTWEDLSQTVEDPTQLPEQEPPTAVPDLSPSEADHFELSGLFPAADGYDDTVWQDRNSRTMNALVSCMATNTCRANQTKVVLLGSYHFHLALVGGTAGEEVWCNSIMAALEELGYTMLFSMTTEIAVHQYRMIPDLVQAVILESAAVRACFQGRYCVKRPNNRLGIPFWKIFGLQWWGDVEGHYLSPRWTLSPENYRNERFYLGYSIERSCRRRTFVPFSERPNQAYILGKLVSYFYTDSYGWEDEWYEYVNEVYGTTFVAGMRNDTTFASQLPPATRNLGPLSQDEFLTELGRSRVLVSIGHPFTSPSPYEALCLGVPVINSVQSFSKENPKDKSFWSSQHNPIMRIGEPYVYSVVMGDRGGFEDAMAKALGTPIEPYIPSEMTHRAVRERMAQFLDFDWQSLGFTEMASRSADREEVFLM